MVYPLLDAAHSRWFYFSSACRPFGLVSLFPDTKTAGDWGNGYCYGTDTIKDFSHVHEWQLSGVAVMPVTFTETSIAALFTNYASSFSHKTGVIKPGYYSVTPGPLSDQNRIDGNEAEGLPRVLGLVEE